MRSHVKIASGSITTNKLAAQAVTAAKINVKDLFAPDITATGTIRGRCTGAKGEIGGFQINSTRLYSVDSSGTYAAYFGSYDFNKTNAFVAQTKVNGSWINTIEMRYDGSIISRKKTNTNVRVTLADGGVICQGSTVSVELRREIKIYEKMHRTKVRNLFLQNTEILQREIVFGQHGCQRQTL